MKTRIKIIAATAAIAAALAACGGGGGGNSAYDQATTGTQPETTSNLPTIQTSVPALTYDQASPEYEFVAAFNDFRQKLGLGLLAQNAQLDMSAQNHMLYITTNWIGDGGKLDLSGFTSDGLSLFHTEEPGYTGFTGARLADRNRAANYAGSYASEEISFSGGAGGKVAFDILAGTIYHRYFLMNQSFRDIGVAVAKDQAQTTVLEMGYVQSAQSNAADYLGTYPRDGQGSVPYSMVAESPNPFPDLSTGNSDYQTKTGYPVSVNAKAYSNLEVLTFSITEQGGSVPLPARLMTSQNDPRKMLATDVAFLVTNSPFKPQTTYNVSFSGRVNNVLVNKAWSFTTK